MIISKIMTVAELHFLETVPKYLKDISEELKALNKSHEEVEEKSETSSDSNGTELIIQEVNKSWHEMLNLEVRGAEREIPQEALEILSNISTTLQILEQQLIACTQGNNPWN